MTQDKRVFRHDEIKAAGTGWVADLSSGDTANPDCYWYFGTKIDALWFLNLVAGGMDARAASGLVTGFFS